MAVKVSGCGTAVRLDFGAGFVTIALVDSVTPWPQSKTIVDTPDLTCASSAEVGREEQSTLVFDHYWDPQDANQTSIVTNFEDSLADFEEREITAQVVSAAYTTTGGGSALAVTWEATVQIASITPQEVTPEGFYKRTVTLLRTSDITVTSA